MISLQKGVEHSDPILLSPMWILLKLGVPLEIARYFRSKVSEYHIEETVLKIGTSTFTVEMITNGYTFSSQVRFFSKPVLKGKLEVIER